MYLKEKLKLLFLPFILLSISIIGGYTFLNWLFIIKLQAFSFKEDITNLWIPFVLPWIPILIFLRPGIKRLKLNDQKGNLPGLYIFIAGFAIIIPTLIAQLYLHTATGKLTKLQNIEQIVEQPDTKYYTVDHFYLDKQQASIGSHFDVSGKNNQYLNIKLYVVLPIHSSKGDTATNGCFAWYGLKYSKQISNRLDREEKEEKYQQFLKESQADFDTKDVDKFVYFDRVGNNGDREGYLSAINNNEKYPNSSTTVLLPVNAPFAQRNGNKFAWIFGSFGIGAVIWLLMIAIPKLKSGEKLKQEGKSLKNSEVKEFLGFFVPKKDFFITPILIDINILVFLMMFFSGLGFISFSSGDLLRWGANFKPSTTAGEWWRLLTSVFLHGGIMHLLANMYGLLFAGIFLEPRLGKTKYASIYLLTGIFASISSLWWHDATISVGASGAIFGLYGVLIALLVNKVFPQGVSKALLASTLIFVGYNLVMGLTGGIDNAAHIGGLVSGLVIGFLLSPSLKRQQEFEEAVEQFNVENIHSTIVDEP